MRKFRSKSENRDGQSPSAPKSNMRSIFLLLAIAALALFLRVIFAYDVAVSDGFAFSGSSASYHHKVITTFLETGVLITSDSTLNFPFGSVNPNPPGFDLVAVAVAWVGTALGMQASKAAYIALLSSSPVLGTLSVIVAYFLGKEVFGKKSAGLLAALFVAICPAAITQTVLSNGTEIPFVLFLSLIMAVFVFRAVSAIPQTTDQSNVAGMLKSNKPLLFNSVMAGLAFLCIMLSWGEYRPLLVAFVATMAVMVAADRFTNRDPIPTALAFTLMIALPSLLAIPVHVYVGLWEPMMFGNTIFALICVALCFGFAMARKLPWTLSVPVFVIVAAVIFIYLGVFADGMLATIVNGGDVAPTIGDASRRIPLSTLSVMFGWATLWFGWAVVAMRIWNLPSNKDSRPYLFLPVWMIAMMAMGWGNASLAALAVPAYALGFAGVMAWLFRVTGLSEYYQSLKGVDAKTFLRRLIKPIPFGAILAVALLIIAPNAIYAIDASISYNDKEDYNDNLGIKKELFGSVGYYVDGADAKERSELFESLSHLDKDGAMVTGQSNVVDASNNGFKSVSDAHGNGLAAASHILLSNGGNGEAIAAMMYRIISSKGGIAAFETELKDNGMSPEIYDAISKADRDVAKSRADIISDPERFGKFRPDIDDESVRYVVFKKALIENYDAYRIATMYDAVCAKAGVKITYLAVSGDMLPLSMQSQAIVNMYAAGYYVNNGTMSQFFNAFEYNQQVYFNGIKDTFADTVLWRAAIGLLPSEGKTAQSLFNDAGNGSAIPTPGNGLAGFKLVEWKVKYNPSEDAKYDTPGWEVLPAQQAISKFNENGGSIGHISSLPIMFEYVSPTDKVEGTVKHGADGVKGIEVSAVDADGLIKSVAVTDDAGKYALPIFGGETEIRFRAAVHDGKGIPLANIGVADDPNIVVPATSYNGTIVPHVFVDGLVFKGKASGMEYLIEKGDIGADGEISIASIVPDVYDVEVVRNDAVIKTVTVTIHPGNNIGHEIKADKNVVITLKDSYDMTPVVDLTVNVSSLSPAGFSEDIVISAAEGKGEVSLPVKTGSENEYRYRATVTTAGYYGQAEFSSSLSTVTVKCYKATPVTVDPNATNILYNGHMGKPVVGDVKIPMSPFGLGNFTIYSIDNTGKVSISLNDAPQDFKDAYEVRGKLKDGDKAIVGTVGFIMDNGAAVYVSATVAEGYKVMLPAGNYHVYAFSSDEKRVGFDVVTVGTENLEKDILTESGRKVSGTVQVLGKNARYVPVTIVKKDPIENFPTKLVVTTDDIGRYGIVLPTEKMATAKIVATGFLDEPKIVDIANDRFTFVSVQKTVNIENNTGYVIKIDSTEIANGATESVTLRNASVSNWILSGFAEGEKVVWSDDAIIRPDEIALLDSSDPLDVLSVDSSWVTLLYALTVEDVGSNPSFTIVPDDSDSKFEYSSNKAYLEEGKAFTVTALGNGKILVEEATLTGPKTSTATKALTVSTYVGTLPEGSAATLDESRVYHTTGTGVDIEFEKTDSLYVATIPYVANVSVTADFTYKFSDEGVKRNYKTTVTRDVAADKDAITINVSLENDGSPTQLDGDASFDPITVTLVDSTDLKEVKVEFDVTVKSSDPSEPLKTLSISGSNWKSLRFYDGVTEISAIPGGATTAMFHAVGVYDGMEYAAEDLTITLSDIEGNEVAKTILNDTGWATTPSTGATKVSSAADVAGGYEYSHGVMLVNDDYFTKTFSVTATFEDPDSKWIATFVSEDGKIMKAMSSGIASDIEVPGNSSKTVYVKFTSAFGEKTTAPGVSLEVACAGYDISTDDDVVTIEGGKATFKSVSMELDLGVTDASASGRGVFNEDGTISNIVWALVAGTVLLLVLTVWLGMRRGVFTRRK